MAALVGDGACEINKNLTYEINVESVINLKIISKVRLFFFSTCSVYGFQDKIINENSTLNPLSTYAKTKIESENILSDANFQ